MTYIPGLLQNSMCDNKKGQEWQRQRETSHVYMIWEVGEPPEYMS